MLKTKLETNIKILEKNIKDTRGWLGERAHDVPAKTILDFVYNLINDEATLKNLKFIKRVLEKKEI